MARVVALRYYAHATFVPLPGDTFAWEWRALQRPLRDASCATLGAQVVHVAAYDAHVGYVDVGVVAADEWPLPRDDDDDRRALSHVVTLECLFPRAYDHATLRVSWHYRPAA